MGEQVGAGRRRWEGHGLLACTGMSIHTILGISAPYCRLNLTRRDSSLYSWLALAGLPSMPGVP